MLIVLENTFLYHTLNTEYSDTYINSSYRPTCSLSSGKSFSRFIDQSYFMSLTSIRTQPERVPDFETSLGF